MLGKILTTYHVYWPNGNCERGQVYWRRDPSYFEIRDLVKSYLDGGDLEHVAVLVEGHRRDMFVDEEGIRKKLPRNETATRIYRNNWLTQHPSVDRESLPCIVGPAVLFDRIIWT
jgi:hypothetical protein